MELFVNCFLKSFCHLIKIKMISVLSSYLDYISDNETKLLKNFGNPQNDLDLFAKIDCSKGPSFSSSFLVSMTFAMKFYSALPF